MVGLAVVGEAVDAVGACVIEVGAPVVGEIEGAAVVTVGDSVGLNDSPNDVGP